MICGSLLEEISSGVGGESLAWDIIIPKLDYESQRKMALQNKRLSDIVNMNAESDLRRFQRHIREDKYMWVYCIWYTVYRAKTKKKITILNEYELK